MGQLLKKTLIIKNIDNGRQIFGFAKIHKNSIFKICFELKNISITDDLTAAVISSNLPVQFIQFRSKEFEVDLDKDTGLDGIVVIILNKHDSPLAASDCDSFLLSGYLDTIKNLKRQIKQDFSFNNKWQNPGKPSEVFRNTQEFNEPMQTLKDILEQPKIFLNNNNFEKEKIKNDDSVWQFNNQSITNNGPFKNEPTRTNSLKTDGELTTDDINVFRFSAKPSSYYSQNSYVDNDILLREDSTLGDDLKIASENYYDYERALNSERPKKPFYETIKGELEELFNKHEHEIVLEKLIAHSKFCKIMYEENKYYVVGLIFEDNVPQFICYGVPTYNPHMPPKELEGFCSYVPASRNNLNGFGYWLMYQDTETGKTIYPNE